MTTLAATAEHRPLSLEDYHREAQHDSNSTLKLFRLSAVAYYHQRVTRRLPRTDTTPERTFGTNGHAMLLEREKFGERVAVIPRDVLSASGAKSGKAWKEWEAAHAGRIHLKLAEYDELAFLVESVWQSGPCREFLSRVSLWEHPIFWTTAEGYRLKCCVDAADLLAGQIADVKTTTQGPADFWRSVKVDGGGFGYAAQAALYCDGYEALYGTRPTFRFLCIRKVEGVFDPYVRTLPEALLDYGRDVNRCTLERLYACKRGERPWTTDGHDVVCDLDYPGRVFYGND